MPSSVLPLTRPLKSRRTVPPGEALVVRPGEGVTVLAGRATGAGARGPGERLPEGAWTAGDGPLVLSVVRLTSAGG